MQSILDELRKIWMNYEKGPLNRCYFSVFSESALFRRFKNTKNPAELTTGFCVFIFNFFLQAKVLLFALLLTFFHLNKRLFCCQVHLLLLGPNRLLQSSMIVLLLSFLLLHRASFSDRMFNHHTAVNVITSATNQKDCLLKTYSPVSPPR